MEVLTREGCPVIYCRDGVDEETKKDCERCKGTGYIQQWVDLFDFRMRLKGFEYE